ncbi:MAG TPA: phosphatase PAP2 family protein [Longimicrobiaceae bacterium]|nr:phosphatase PAP2 family protein [Longimicrobiaceae bacterium]
MWTAVVLAGGVLPAAAQQVASPPPADTSKPPETLFTRHDAYLAGGFVLATIALGPADRAIARELQDSSRQSSHFLKNTARAFDVTAVPGSLVIGTGMYAVGRLTHQPRVADLGLHGTEAILLGTAITDVVKNFAGRRRPFVDVEHPYDFRFTRGFKSDDYKSFPSGHTTAGFAAAAAVTAETSRWWPGSGKYVGPLMFGGATLIGASRMYENKHWASDVLVGAAIGTFSGLKVVRYSHAHPNNPIDRRLLSFTVAPAPSGGAVVAWTFPTGKAGAVPAAVAGDARN